MKIVKLEEWQQSDNRSISDHAYDKLVSKILRMELPPGAPMVEKNLIDELQIGRTPIREALHRLAGEGLVCREPHRGVFICEATPEYVRDICEFRMSIEGRIANLAAANQSEQHVEKLDGIAQRLEALDPVDDFDDIIKLGRQYYLIMAEAVGNVHYMEMVPRLYNVGLWFLFYAGKIKGDWPELCNEFRAVLGDLVAPISKHQADQAEAVMRLYVTNYRVALDNHLDALWHDPKVEKPL
ncbi:MAG: GntR family transcriptional regulator [Pseudomonadales bacterium]